MTHEKTTVAIQHPNRAHALAQSHTAAGVRRCVSTLDQAILALADLHRQRQEDELLRGAPGLPPTAEDYRRAHDEDAAMDDINNPERMESDA